MCIRDSLYSVSATSNLIGNLITADVIVDRDTIVSQRRILNNRATNEYRIQAEISYKQTLKTFSVPLRILLCGKLNNNIKGIFIQMTP